ncbi:2-oxoglutarate dehydrogenase complex dihydrolipoyllysine-residue succinyltransferase [Methylogaea oryzae]|uniref:Dihydrolipoyllysine-residue succinyltransferase component of 2-oxoglutarate dehydrogenase complex n=3 Tax=Methylogaea oryzae TaxID=1295382 RepID=A0A8D4VRC3_9GAMM|nr:2-oxoglutarate dehydrogenase complex dihydrolipoyllysine-residue succinyltransferase [Methylogaea oryzae]BBL71164.1 dihydrolipoyllysine-residue succinyltransferase component of 2-oxoglutarate dehydrogenase complex [Methylogaea oryzae]
MPNQTLEVRVPNLPESVSDATVALWHKQPGDAVTKNENLLDLETDKVVLEVPAPADGVLGEHSSHAGQRVKAGDLLALILTDAAAAKTARPPTEPPAPKSESSAPAAVASPSVRRLLAENNLDAAQIAGTGKDGRLTKEDVTSYLAEKSAKPAPSERRPLEDDAGFAAVAAAPPANGHRTEQRVPMTRLRARIAERLLEAQHSTATLTTFNEVDLRRIMDLRAQYNARFEKEHGIKLGIMSFFVKAAVEALKRFPAANATIDGEDIIYHNYYDIGIAVSTNRGLVVPILRDADRMIFANIEKNIAEFAQKSREGRLSMDDLKGGTFTITNGGIFGSLLSTPILNPPQSTILGMHAIKERPIAEDGQVVIRPMMYLALSYDHRLVDGREAVQFLFTIKELLEDPARLLLHL